MAKTFPPGTVIADRFVIERNVASGGMGVVLRAKDLTTQQPVAVKLLLRFSDMQRFTREAQLLSRLRHPRIVSYVDNGCTSDGEPYLVMEWLDGTDLSQLLRQRSISLSESLRILSGAAQALHAAHQHGVVHRDVKPSNLFLRNGFLDRIVLIDFGIARSHQAGISALGDPSMTATGQIIGTPHYMAPEQARGERDLGPAADIFALGCVLFHCLTGRPPFTGASSAIVLGQLLLTDAPRLRSIRPELPKEIEALEALLAAMLVRDPEKRLRNAQELLTAIAALPNLAEIAPPETLALETQRPPSSSGGEQQLACVILADPQDTLSEELGTLPLVEKPASVEDLDTSSTHNAESLRALLHSFGARVEVLGSGGLVATLDVDRYGSATDQAVQAARAALSLKEKWSTAKVVLTSGRALACERLPQGEALERALHLSRHARELGEKTSERGVLIDEVTAGLLSARFVVTEPAQGRVLVEERPLADVDRPLLGQPTPCIGRERELALLESLLRECEEDSVSRAALVLAPPGIGKSRLRHEFQRRIVTGEQHCLMLIGRADPLSISTPYGLIAQALLGRCGIADGEAPAQKRQKLSRCVEAIVDASAAPRIIAQLCALCRIDDAGSEHDALHGGRRDPSMLAEEMRQCWTAYLLAESTQQPVLLIFEDLHWADRLTVDLIDTALRELAEHPLLVLALARPEVRERFPSLWQGRSFLEVRLPGLSRKGSERLIQQVLGNQINATTRDRIVAQAAGNALFLEEMIRAVAEGKGDALPSTVLAMLQSRLGRLDVDARRVLRVASVFGETFWLGGVVALLAEEDSRDAVERSLALLIQEELLTRRKDSQLSGEVEYAFHHALVREAAYSLLIAEDAVRYHALAGGYLERTGHAQPLVIAEHLIRGNEKARAVSFLLHAAQRALDGNDLDQAIANCERAIALPKSDEMLGLLRALQTQAAYWKSDYPACARYATEALEHLRTGSAVWFQILGSAVVACARSGRSEEWRTLHQRGLDAVAEPSAENEQLICLSRFAFLQYLSGGKARVGELTERLHGLYARLPVREPLTRAQYHHFLSLHAMAVGDMATYCEHLENVIAAFAEAGDLRNSLMERPTLALGLDGLGADDEAMAITRETLAECQRLRHTQPAMYAKMALALLLLRGGEFQRGRELLDETLAYYRAAGHRPWQGLSSAVYARVEFAAKDYDRALHYARQAQEFLGRESLYLGMILSIEVRPLLRLGRVQEALPLARTAYAVSTQNGGLIKDDLDPVIAMLETLIAANLSDEAKELARKSVAYVRMRHASLPRANWKARYLQVAERIELFALVSSLGVSTD